MEMIRLRQQFLVATVRGFSNLDACLRLYNFVSLTDYVIVAWATKQIIWPANEGNENHDRQSQSFWSKVPQANTWCSHKLHIHTFDVIAIIFFPL